jgi:hypothetical protein
MNRGAWLLTLVLTACSSGPPRSSPQHRPDPALASRADLSRAFVDRMLDALERQDQDAWWQLLSARMRERIGNPATAHDHLATWRRDVLPLAPMLRRADIAVDPDGPQRFVTYAADGAAAEPLALVVLEDGVLRLDEN